MLTRRHVLSTLGAVSLAGLAPTRLAWAAAPTDRRFVLIILRGALDGLAAVPPYGDPDYRRLRGTIALAEPGQEDGVLDLGGRFGLHPALAPLHPYYQRGEMLVLHAVSSGYRGRSHFDGQDVLESGVVTPHGARDGWVNRALAAMPASGEVRTGLALGQTIPLALRGAIPVASWAPTDMPEVEPGLMRTIAQMYRGDPLLGPALDEGLKGQSFADQVMNDGDRMNQAPNGPPAPGRQQFRQAAAAAGRLLAAEGGARVAVLDVGGWDTHANQGGARGRLAGVLQVLADGVNDLAQGLGPAWGKTVVLVATEFGRTVQINGTGGTDHGTGAAAFLLGGAVAGGKVLTTWPGLGAGRLFEDRDLMPTTDLRSVAKAVLIEHLRVPSSSVETKVFPGAGSATPTRGLLRV